MRPRLRHDARRDPVVPFDLRRVPIRQIHCHGRPHHAADGCGDLHQASRVCVIFFEELRGSVMMPRGLIGMARCGRGWCSTLVRVVVMVPPIFQRFSLHRRRNMNPSPLDFEATGSETTQATIRFPCNINGRRTLHMIGLGGPSAFLSPLLRGCSIRCSAGAGATCPVGSLTPRLPACTRVDGVHSHNVGDGKAILGIFRA